ncbi:MAG TPA: hypothetical protein VMT57_00440 [Candidatus Thermoplasmatota archaeon]|nr:hypothetical protein [Candidatus Thermoplasmatota archaeon]
MVWATTKKISSPWDEEKPHDFNAAEVKTKGDFREMNPHHFDDKTLISGPFIAWTRAM